VGIIVFLSLAARLGSDIHLLRREDTPSEAMYHQTFSFLVVSGTSVAVVGLLATPALGSWLNDDRYVAPLRVLLVLLPLDVISAPAVVRLERGLRYRRVAVIELTQQLLFLGTGVTLAWRGLGVWAPVAGYGVSELWLVVASYALSAYRPRWLWSTDLLRDMLQYGLGYSASAWLKQARYLVNPLIVGRYAGAEAVGYVALAIRVVETLSFVWTATWRISIVALARLERNRARLLEAANEGMGLQVLASGPIMAVVGWAAPWIFPVLLGARWLPALEVYPFIALGFLSSAAFTLHTSALYVLRRNWEVARFQLANVASFTVAALLLVPRMGFVGYGWAEVAALASYAVLHLAVVLQLGRPAYAPSLLWLLAFTVPLFGATATPWLWLSVLAPLLWPAARKQARAAAAILVPATLRVLHTPPGAP
jgi:PST family polysaccharide transporter